jgi:TPR repeat protein
MDHEKAFGLYLQASKQKHPAATYRVAVCYEVGAGTKKDANKAILYYRRAYLLGNGTAMYKLAMILLHGDLGVTANPKEGISLLKKAINTGGDAAPHALYELGLLNEGVANEKVGTLIIPVRTQIFILGHFLCGRAIYKSGFHESRTKSIPTGSFLW